MSGSRAVRVSALGDDEPALVVEPAGDAALVGGLVGARLVRHDDIRATLHVEEGSAAASHRVLLGPPSPGPIRGTSRREVVVDGWRIEVEVENARHAALREQARRGPERSAHGGPTEVRAIIPGAVVSVAVVAGDEVAAGQRLLVVEAMKMQNELRAPRAGRIGRVAVGAGERIEVGALLLVIE